MHGDIDFMVILKPNLKIDCIIEAIKPLKYIIKDENKSSMVYKNKQVDFYLVSSYE